MCAQKKDSSRFTEIRNSKAHRDYAIGERFEAGIQLRGTEVKSIRDGRAQIGDSFGRFERGELWLVNAHIDQYAHGSYNNHEPRRPRKLFLHQHQLRKVAQALEAGGRVLVPLRLYFKQALVKVEVALGTGKKLHDKRDDLRKKSVMRDLNKGQRFKPGPKNP